jgi:hypothetical protein
MDHAVNTALKWTISGLVIAALLVVDFAAPQVGHDWLFAITMGICIGQINLIATWAVLAPGNFVVRFFWSLLLGVFMWYALVAGNEVSSPKYFSFGKACMLGTTVLFGLVVTQIPLWAAKHLFRWRLTTGDQAVSWSPARLQFQISDLLIATFLLSVTLSPLRTILPPGDMAGFHFDKELFAVLPVVAFCNLVVTVPCVWGGFFTGTRFVALAFGWLVYCGVLTALELGVLCALFGDPHDSRIFWLIYLVNIAQCITVFGVLRVYRTLGYRLVRASRSLPGDAISGPEPPEPSPALIAAESTALEAGNTGREHDDAAE